MSTDRTTPRWSLIFSLLGLWMAAPAMAQQPLEMPRLLDPARMGPVQFRVFSGRVTMHGLRLGSYTTSTNNRGRNERLSLSMNNHKPVLSYESTSPTEHLSVEASASDRLLIRRSPRGTSSQTPVEFEQATGESLALTVGAKEGKKVYRAESLWHLLIAHREVCRQSLIPLLKVLNRNWDLLKTAEQVESTLLSESTARDLPDRRLWATLVDRLGDDRFSNREAADRQLREAGRAVVTYLRQLDSSRLDRRAALSHPADHPGRIIRGRHPVARADRRLVAGDPAVWLLFLARDDEPTRRLAAARLDTLLGRPIPFTPAADAATRKREIEALRQQISSG